MTFYDQAEFDVRCEWGLKAVEVLAPISDVVVIVDILSFSTAIEVATGRGAQVFPYRWKDESANEYAKSIGAELADSSRTKGRWSLSPASLLSIPKNTKLVLPSPNGSTLSLATGKTPTLAGSLRNAQAIAEACQKFGTRISIIAAGEKWSDGSLRPALEDWIGAGAIISFLKGSISPEAESAKEAFLSTHESLVERLRRCSSGKELIERGFESDVEFATKFNVSTIVPTLKSGCYVSTSEIKEIEDANKAPPNTLSSLGMSDIPTPNDEQKMSQWFLRFSEQTEGSPMYQFLSQQISSDRELLALASYSNSTQPAPNLFLAAIHFLLMKHPSEGLAKYYSSLEGQFQATPEVFDCFKRFAKKFEPEIKSLLQTRLVQTNEVQRCALLFPALNFVSKKLDHQKLTLIDIGASGGLNFLMDQAYIRYSDGASIGAERSPLQIICKSKGELIPRFQNAQIAMRIGIDLNPVNLLNPDERQWNLALIWPDQTERIERIKSALQLLETTDISFKKGSANQVLPQVIRDVPSDQAICVMHSFTLNQFSKEDREVFDSLLRKTSQTREIWRISLEWIGTQYPELSVTHYASGNKGPVLNLAKCHGHGEWIQWIDGQEKV